MGLSKREAYRLSVKDSFKDARILFWEYDLDALNFVEDHHIIINRVLSQFEVHPGSLDVIDKVYNIEDVRWYCLNEQEIHSQETYATLSKRYKIPLSKFKKYWGNQKQTYAL